MLFVWDFNPQLGGASFPPPLNIFKFNVALICTFTAMAPDAAVCLVAQQYVKSLYCQIFFG